MKVKEISLTANLSDYRDAVCLGLCDSLSRAIRDKASVAKVNYAVIYDENNVAVATFLETAGNISVSSGEEGSDAYVDITLKDTSNSQYSIAKICVGHLNNYFIPTYSRTYLIFTLSESKANNEFLIVRIRLYIR